MEFRDFLRYAKGSLNLDSRVCESSKRLNGIVKQVADQLEARGYTVHTNIGSSDFKVDLGIVSKTSPEQYELGILLDHVRDSQDKILDVEVMYPRILVQKGWKTYRLSKLNWWRDPKGEIDNIIQKLEVS